MIMDSFDRIVWAITAVLVLAIGSLVLLGEHLSIGAGIDIVTVSPKDGSNPPMTAPIQIEFGQTMNVASVQSRLVIRPAVDGQFCWEGNTLSFTPNRPLLALQSYTVSLRPGAESMSGRRTVRTLEWSFRPRLPAVLYLTSDQVMAQDLRVIALDGSGSRELLATPSTILGLSTSPDGLQIALAILREGGKSELWLIDSATGKQRQTINCMPSSCSNPVWSPNGKLLAYERNEPTSNLVPGLDRVWLYDLASGKTEPVFQDNQVLGSRPVWSTNGRRLAFFDWNAHSVRIIDLGDRNAFLVPSPLGDSGSLSPDGAQLVYTNLRAKDGPSSPQLWLARLDAQLNLAPLIQGSETVRDNSPAWSPDGQWIAFLRRRLDQLQGNQVVLYRLNTGELRQLTNETNYNNTELKWDMTGQYLLIQRVESSGTNAKPQIWVYDVAAGRLTQLVDNGLKGEWLP